MTMSVQDFIQLVLRNLEKNGFPEKSVSFPLEKMYESASQHGFSFNKVRDELKAKLIDSVIDGERIIFTKMSEPLNEEQFDMSNLASMAEQMIAKMSPEEQAQIAQMMQNMDPAELTRMQEQWESMPLDQKKRAMNNLKP